MNQRIWIVFAKELTDNLRDRRALGGALFFPLLGPLIMLLLFSLLSQSTAERADKPLALPVVGADYAPNLIAYLRQNDAEILPPPADPEAAVRVGTYDVVLIIPDSFVADWEAGRPATVRLVRDASRQAAGVTIRRAETLLGNYSQQIGQLRLLARGLSPSITRALALERINVATPQSQGAGFLSMMPYFVIFSTFMGGLYIAIDTTAGERERGTLEPLIINPISRAELVLGKMAATLVFTLVAVAETLVGFAVLLPLLPLKDLGLRVSFSPAAFLSIFALTLPMMWLATAIQIIVATFARNFKEAQNYLQMLPLIPALPGMVLAISPIKTEWWMMLIPTFGQQLLINDLMRGEALHLGHVALVSTMTLVAGGALTFISIRLYAREQVVLGR